ncbi:peptidoglycan bridge formation glycyltransferase FemA/FemB family protein [Candidatus Collierbacteria bacterium]|nr:peptidoglycan bridge formation glycyltransferase FemA/FemB family protein [Candidatus Collierbacteria bacterium]
MVREVTEREKKNFNKLAAHPLQSWEWGRFREKTGVQILRLGRYEKRKLVETAQITFHKIPHLPFSIGYWPKGVLPSSQTLETIKKEAKNRRVVMVKIEPNIIKDQKSEARIGHLKRQFGLAKGRPLFTRWSFWLDLAKSEDELLAGMKQKTRYNTRLAEKKGVKVIEDNSREAFDEYWWLTKETTKRQGFYAHTQKYHQLMFETLQPSGMAHLFKAVFQGKTLVTWIIFLLNDILYYPYGASTREDREVFASNLMMWEVIKFGKKNGCRLFDMWGSPGPAPKPSDPWVGFHRFKEGYGAKLVEFVGTYDLVVNPLLYWPYRLGEEMRWVILKFLAKFR